MRMIKIESKGNRFLENVFSHLIIITHSVWNIFTILSPFTTEIDLAFYEILYTLYIYDVDLRTLDNITQIALCGRITLL